jgi:hypothetical protein
LSHASNVSYFVSSYDSLCHFIVFYFFLCLPLIGFNFPVLILFIKVNFFQSVLKFRCRSSMTHNFILTSNAYTTFHVYFYFRSIGFKHLLYSYLRRFIFWSEAFGGFREFEIAGPFLFALLKWLIKFKEIIQEQLVTFYRIYI